eukprot:GHVN01052839.1.p1 GENE.GHVN01052839.1~~GHVN01052839.1.p1  ORF type:complete len:185 (-),score=54.90 GHVN01052839.1:43-597(-)
MGALAMCAAKSGSAAIGGIRRVVGGDYQGERIERERAPQLNDESSKIEDDMSQDWRWLSVRAERKMHAKIEKNRDVSAGTKSGGSGTGGSPSDTGSSAVAKQLGASFNIDAFSCFVPRTVLEAVADKRIGYSEDFEIIIEEFNSAVVFCDASGFTALTVALDQKENGAEKLGEVSEVSAVNVVS